MSRSGQRHVENEELEQRIYQALAQLERTGEQQCAAAALITRASALEQRLDHAIQIASRAAAKRIAEEARVVLEGIIADAAETLRQAARRSRGNRESAPALGGFIWL